MKFPTGKLAAVTRKVNDISELISNNDQIPPKILSAHYSELISRVNTLSDAYEELKLHASQEEQKDLSEWYQAKQFEFLPLFDQAKDFLQSEFNNEQNFDAASQISTRSSRFSQCSNSSSVRVRLAERKARALAERSLTMGLSNIRREETDLNFELERKRNDLITRKKLLEADTTLMEANILEAELDRLDGVTTNPKVDVSLRPTEPTTKLLQPIVSTKTEVPDGKSTSDGLRGFSNFKSDLARGNLCSMSASDVCNEMSLNDFKGGPNKNDIRFRSSLTSVTGCIKSMGASAPIYTNPQMGSVHSKPFVPSANFNSQYFVPSAACTSQAFVPPGVYGSQPFAQPGVFSSQPQSSDNQGNHFNDNLLCSSRPTAREIGTEIAAAQAIRASLPRINLTVFDGTDLTKFNSFILDFERIIESHCKDDVFRYQALVQHTSGHPKKLVESCNQHSASKAFTDAKSLLIGRYGDQYAISYAFIHRLKFWPVIKTDDARAIEDLSIYLTSCANVATNMTALNQLNSANEIMSIISKLPYKMQNSFKYYSLKLRDSKGTVEFIDLVNFVQYESRVLNQPMFSSSSNVIDKRNVNLRDEKKKVCTTLVENKISSSAKLTCLYCKKLNHVLDKCFIFKKLPYRDRSDFVRSSGFCFGCLNSSNHRSVSCPSRLICDTCKGKHPTSLHRENLPVVVGKSRPPSDYYSLSSKGGESDVDAVPNVSVRTTLADVSIPGVKRQKVMHAIVPVRINIKDRKPIHVYASLDGCSSDCWIREGFLDTLGIKSNKTTISMTTMENTHSSVLTKIVSNLSVSDCLGNNDVVIPILYTKKNWPFDPSDVPQYDEIRQYDYLDRVPFDFIDSNIELLIGMNMPGLIKPLKLVDGAVDGPYATFHVLGWALNGPIDSYGLHGGSCFRTKLENYSVLEERIERYFCREFSDMINDSKTDSVEDLKWLERVQSSIKLLPSRNYQIDLPFREVNVDFPQNYSQARTRFRSAQRRFVKNPNYFKEYKMFMDSMLKANFAERVPDCELRGPPGKSWYLVHHSVYHKVKGKIRIVFDCSLTHDHVSLNDKLLQGPDYTNNLLGVLLRFRSHNIAVMADIQKMFYQVKVTPKHTDFLRFLWFPGSDPTQDPVEYRLLVHVFGAKSSPSIANYALRKTAHDFEPSGQANVSVHENFYVDDYLQSFKTDLQAVQMIECIRTLLSKGGFNLTGFISNSEEVMRNIAPSIVANSSSCIDMFSNDLRCSSALGVLWDIKSDELGFRVNLQDKPFTRRGLLSTSFSLYDPLGLVSPALLLPKELFREACLLKLEWDDPLPLSINNKWSRWLKEVPLLAEYRISRCYYPPGVVTDWQLHIFSDGSETAYGAIAYARCVMADSSIICSPIMAKTRLTPFNKNIHPSIPRIELQAAILAVNLYSIINRELKISFNSTYFWTDSSTVLRYISNETRRFHRFVANRVTKIRSLSGPEKWRFVPGELNPADIASRGLWPLQFVKNTVWASGPNFLRKSVEDWPHKLLLSPLNENEPEIKPDKYSTKAFATIVNNKNEYVFDRILKSCSTWHRLKRRIAWLLRAKARLRGLASMHDNLSLGELQSAEIEIMKLVQSKYYAEIISGLQHNLLRHKHCLTKLNPFIDSNGIIRVGGRLRQSKSIGYNVKHPIILPNSSYISELIVRHFHIYECGHLGRESVRSSLRSHYWIVQDSSLIRRVLKFCVICRKLKAQPVTQQMADLPHDRIEGDKPAFFSTGIDFFGPFHTVTGRRSQKRYGVVFSCMASRAIHLEIAASLTTDSFIMSLRRFICRRGMVKIIRCDNGTNLVGAKIELRKALDELNQSQIIRNLELSNIEWRFRPPTASHFGGVWEREIRTVRQTLNALLHEQPIKLTDECLCTLMCETEAILNNRPISTISNDPADQQALTPNHVLHCDFETSFPPGLFKKSDLYTRKRWRQVQYLADVFWSRWRKSYLSLLQERQKWVNIRPSLAVGDLVLVKDYVLPRNRWPIGRIERVIYSDDSLVRSVSVKIAKCKDFKHPATVTILERPISKVILIRSIDTL